MVAAKGILRCWMLIELEEGNSEIVEVRMLNNWKHIPNNNISSEKIHMVKPWICKIAFKYNYGFKKSQII